jgi:uncharacterized protein (TIGR02186 family)
MIRLLAFLVMITPAFAQETVVAGLSQTRVAITAQFEGSEILIYGAVKRSAPGPEGPPLEVIITAEGPAMPVMVRSKDRRFGLWVNTGAVRIDQAPSFYAIATTAPLAQVLTETEDLRHRISIPRAIRAVGVAAENLDAPSYTTALIRIREASGAYGMREGAVTLSQDTLFRADVALPANLTEGDYRVRIFLTRGGAVIDSFESTINVRKEGLERWLTNLARQQPLIYGLLSLLIAVVAGWAASAGFRFLRA